MKKFLVRSALLLGFVAFSCQTAGAKPVQQTVESPGYPVVILGGGIGALTSAVYLGRGGIEPLVIEGSVPGGLITQSHSVQNWPGEMEITGAELAAKVRKQAEATGAKFQNAEVVGVEFSKRPYTIQLRSLESGKTYSIRAESVVVAMGTTPNFLHIPGEKEYWGRGVTNCAICDGALYQGQTVGIVGGGDAAVLEGLYLANIAKEVHLFVRKGSFRATEEKRLKTLLEKPHVIVHYNAEVASVKGDADGVTSVVLKSGEEMPLSGLFLAIGSRPNSKLFQKALDLNENGYIITYRDQETSVEGIYAIGDIVDPVYKQAITAAADGAKAAMQAQHYVSERMERYAAKQAKNQPSESQILPTLIEVIEITSADQFETELRSSKTPIFVDFYASWCGPCRQISPLIDSTADSLSGKVKFLKVNIDRNEKLASQYKIRSMPTAILFDEKGKMVDRKVGSGEISDLLKKLESEK